MNTPPIKINGIPVKLNTNHLRAHEDVKPILKEAVTKAIESGISFDTNTFVVTVDMGRTVGRSGLVKTTETDKIEYIVREGRIHPSRCVRDRLGDETQFVTIVFRRTPVRIKLVTAWIGVKACREPNDTTFETEELRQEAINFWNQHALVI